MKEDWTECLLGEISSKITKGSTPTTYGYKYQNEGINFIKIENVVKGRIDLKSIHQFISEEAHNSQKRSQLKEGDVLFSIAGTIGETCLISEDILPANTNQAFAIINGFNKVLIADFLRKQLDSFVSRKLKAKARGGAMNNVSLTDLKELNVVIPPLIEQKAIVKKIEELFSSLDSGIADLKKAQDQLMIYRQAVLSSCLPKNEKIEISELVENLSQGWSPKCINQNSTDSNQWAVIKTSAIQAGKFVESENKILPDTLEPREQHEIKKGDILITRAGPRVRVGICCLVKKTRPKLINCDKVYRIELNQELVTPEYFEYALNSPEILSEIEIMKSGSSDSGLNLTQKRFLKLEIPICSKEEQHQIVQEIESRLSVCDKVEKDIADSLEKAKALRQSILKKAFEGKLLNEEEIAKCKADKEYEPASVLLERIKEEKKKKKKKKKKK